jgi:DNA-binding NarL/FixJ family response regulator
MASQHDRSRSVRRGPNDKITVLVASAVTERRQRWELRLQEACAICEVAERRALEQIMRHLEPHVLLLDLCLPGLGGVRQLSRIQRLSPQTKIIALAPRADDREGLAALEAGAMGYCGRDIEPGQLRKAVEGVEAGEIWIQRRLVTALLDALRSMKQSARKHSPRGSSRLQGLTPRGYQVAELITAGARNKEIAQQLNITERTVKAHLTELFRNLKVSDRLQLAVLLNREGLRSGALAVAHAVTSRKIMAPAQNGGTTNGHHDGHLADQSSVALRG